MTTKHSRPWWTRITRDLILFTGGLVGVFHQTVISPEAQPALLGTFLLMMGLTVPLRADERRRRTMGDDE